MTDVHPIERHRARNRFLLLLRFARQPGACFCCCCLCLRRQEARRAKRILALTRAIVASQQAEMRAAARPAP
jgi:hypothetical protein